MGWGPALTVLAGLTVWTVRLRALARARRQPPAGPGAIPWPAVSVVVPARNEGRSLPALLASLAQLEPTPAEIIVVDDDSTDDTADVARRAGARVVRPGPRPPGWLGKPWACAAGAREARGEWILFTDADTIHAPSSLGAAVAAAVASGAALVSLIPSHVAVSAWERLQGVFHLILAVATRVDPRVTATAKPEGERRFCIGQYLLFSRRAYEALGGHRLVRGRVAEDLAFAAAVTRAGLGYRLLGAPGLLRVRMYPGGLGDFVAGWRRNFREGLASAGLPAVLEVSAVLGWLVGVPVWLAAAAARGQLAATAAWVTAGVVTAAEVARRQRLVMASPAPVWTALAYPLFAALFVVISALALLDRLRGEPVVWKGRRLTIAR